MTFIAPNLSIIVGASTAAKLLGLAGGLTNLSKMPSCNILLLGSHRKNLSGFSTTAARPHAGFIYYSKVVQDAPPVRLYFDLFSLKYFILLIFEKGFTCSNCSLCFV